MSATQSSECKTEGHKNEPRGNPATGADNLCYSCREVAARLEREAEQSKARDKTLPRRSVKKSSGGLPS